MRIFVSLSLLFMTYSSMGQDREGSGAIPVAEESGSEKDAVASVIVQKLFVKMETPSPVIPPLVKSIEKVLNKEEAKWAPVAEANQLQITVSDDRQEAYPAEEMIEDQVESPRYQNHSMEVSLVPDAPKSSGSKPRPSSRSEKPASNSSGEEDRKNRKGFFKNLFKKKSVSVAK